MSITKFPECRRCLYQTPHRTHTNPACQLCDAGEFFEERTGREKSNHELMNLYKEITDDVDE
jgi:hypothetical protein